MNSTTIESAACPFGWLLADSDAGPIPLQRLGDVPARLAISRGVSAQRALEAMCDGLRQLDAVKTHGYWWAFPGHEGEQLLKHRDLLERGLELYELRQGFAREIRPAPGALLSEVWAPGDPVPWGYELRSGPRTSPWEAFFNEAAAQSLGAHIVWTQPWPEPRQSAGHSWIDRLNLPDRWERLIEAYGSVDVHGLTFGPGLEPGETPFELTDSEPALSYLAMRRDVAEVLWPELCEAGKQLPASQEPAREEDDAAEAAAAAGAGPQPRPRKRKVGERVLGVPDGVALLAELAELNRKKVRGPIAVLANKYECSRDTIERRLKAAKVAHTLSIVTQFPTLQPRSGRRPG